MRLLNVHTYKLEDFFEDKIPEYTILSHTWGDGEVTFADLDAPNAEEQEGWKKIEYTCKETRSIGVRYCWVDTCCIDKSNSAELSEAINSMFMWYEKAKVCYAYLADVDTRNSNDTKGEISRSRWFTRGWTLQELLAPERVKFYDASWKSLGTKGELADIISDRTGIDVGVLHRDPDNLNLNQKSIAMRLSWASKRQTTRVEDIAYCLLGIVGVNMPLLYGEGEKAFVRLQEEILKMSPDLSVFAWDFPNNIIGRDLSEELSEDFKRENISILAPHPRHFADSGKVERIAYNIYGPFSMTNLGLEIKLPIFQFSYSFYCAILGCRIKDQEGYIPTMLLEKVGAGIFSRVRSQKHKFVTTLLTFGEAVAAIPQNLTILRDLDYVEQRAQDFQFNYSLIDYSLPYTPVQLIDDAKELLVDGAPAFLWPKNTHWETIGRDYLGIAHHDAELGYINIFFRIRSNSRDGEIKALRILTFRNRFNIGWGCLQIPDHIDEHPYSESWQEWARSESRSESDRTFDQPYQRCHTVPIGFTNSGFSDALTLTAEKVHLYDKYVMKLTIGRQKTYPNPSTQESQ